MKKIGFILILVMLLSSCGGQTTNENLGGDKIIPLPSTQGINQITDAIVSASFEAKDLLTTSSGTHELSLTIYDYEMFDLVDISTLAVGDTIVVAQEDIKVDTLEKTEGGLVVINGGIENGGVDLYTDSNTVYFESGMDGMKNFFKVGTDSYSISNDFKFIDNSDLEQPNQQFSYKAFAEKLQNGEITCNQFNTTARIIGGEIAEVTLIFTP